MTHPLFGKMKYRERDEQWVGYVPLPRFATVGLRPAEPPPTDEDAERMLGEMRAALENMRSLMRERFGDQLDAAFEEWDREADELEGRAAEEADVGPGPAEQERQRKQAERARRHAERLAKGRYPFGVGTPAGQEPTAKQEAAFRFLTENEQAVYDAVLAEVWDSFRGAYQQEHWRHVAGIRPADSIGELAGRFALTRVDITRESRGGFAHLVFHVDSDWQDEHGLLVVYSPDTREAAWTSWDGLYDLTESDDPADGPEGYVPTPHGQLLEAILTGDEAGARGLVAAGADINALDPDECPPLWIAVDQIEVEEVRRLLAFGADPTLADPDTNTTPLRHARKMHRDMGFAPSKKRDRFMEDILSLAREAAGSQMDEIKHRLEAIIRLLEGATGPGAPPA